MTPIGPTTLLSVASAAKISRYPEDTVRGWIADDLLDASPVVSWGQPAVLSVQASDLRECVKDGGHMVSLELARVSW